MMTPNSIEELSWWNVAQPTSEELEQSGGLQVEDWPLPSYLRLHVIFIIWMSAPNSCSNELPSSIIRE